MKIDNEKEFFYEVKHTRIEHDYEEQENFGEYLEKIMEKNDEKIALKEQSESIEKTSVFLEKKIGKRRTDIFDTLMDF